MDISKKLENKKVMKKMIMTGELLIFSQHHWDDDFEWDSEQYIAVIDGYIYNGHYARTMLTEQLFQHILRVVIKARENGSATLYENSRFFKAPWTIELKPRSLNRFGYECEDYE